MVSDREIHIMLKKCPHDNTKYYCIEDGNDVDSGFTCLDCKEDLYGNRVPNYSKRDMAKEILTVYPDMDIVYTFSKVCGHMVTINNFYHGIHPTEISQAYAKALEVFFADLTK